MDLHHPVHLHLMLCYVGVECQMADWHTILDQLEIPDEAVTGLSVSDKPVLRGKLLQLPAADRPFFFVGQPLEVLKTLRTLLPDLPSGQFLYMLAYLDSVMLRSIQSMIVYLSRVLLLHIIQKVCCQDSPNLWTKIRTQG